MNKNSKLMMGFMSLLMVFSMLLTACAPEKQETQAQENELATATEPPAAAPEAPAVAADWTFPTEDVTLEIWWHEYGPFTAYMEEMIPAYMALHPNVTVNVTKVSSADLNQKLSAAMATGTGPDILDQDASYYVQYYEKGLLEPLNLDVWGATSYAEVADKYLPGGAEAGTFDGEIYALPYQGNSMSLWISNKLFEAAGLDPVADAPKTWEDMISICPKLKIVDGNVTVQKAFDFPYHSARWQLQQFQPITEQFGGELLNADGKTAALNSPAAVKALTLWKRVTDACGDPKTTMNTGSNPNQDFIDGNVAMWITGPWATPQISASEFVGDQFTVVGLPQVNPANPHTMVYGWEWAVNADRPDVNKQVAWDFIKYVLASPEEWLAKAGFVQPVKGLLDTETAKTFPFLAAHMKDVETATWYIRSPYVNEISLAVGAAIEKVVYDNADPQTSLDTAQAEVEKVLK
ncbi:MAG: ABC transporter substrate-binding protein [Chloroflexota bacterium]